MKRAAVTGHTQRLGRAFYELLQQKGYQVKGFSRSNGYDIRDYAVVSRIIDETKGYDLFVNSAKPDFAQTQILYRLARSRSITNVLSIGSAAVTDPPEWTDLHLLEYLTQKIALDHAHRVCKASGQINSMLVNPVHLGDDCLDYVQQVIEDLKL